MIKELPIPELTPLDEPSITLVRPGYKEKYASVKLASDIYKELENYEGKPNRTYMLAVSVSPVEYWGDNKNHDAFEEPELVKYHPTFTSHGTFFKNHVNKDPMKNYGENEKSWYDDEMKRVLVLVAIDNNKAPDIVNDIELGKKIALSMGCKIKYDVCSICGNKSETRDDYCVHMKTMPGKILPDGRKVFVYNPNPTFFDLSKVVRPAGHIEYMIKKINVVPKRNPAEIIVKNMDVTPMQKAASIDKISEEEFNKRFANIKKLSEMEKIINGELEFNPWPWRVISFGYWVNKYSVVLK